MVGFCRNARPYDATKKTIAVGGSVPAKAVMGGSEQGLDLDAVLGQVACIQNPVAVGVGHESRLALVPGAPGRAKNHFPWTHHPALLAPNLKRYRLVKRTLTRAWLSEVSVTRTVMVCSPPLEVPVSHTKLTTARVPLMAVVFLVAPSTSH